MAFRIVVDVPALDRLVNVLWRMLDLREERMQAQIDELTAKIRGSSDGLAKDVADSTPKP